ncbi:MAG: class I SAM-dependent methyltransferase [Alphaproteobacteria bacterium]|nr:class I SAM-dependent methyltransferase [Alphaproteobacteria bacterium]
MLLQEEKEDEALARPKLGQAAQPRGRIGRAFGWIWLRVNGPMNHRAVEALEMAFGETVLEIGCGPGDAIVRLVRGGLARRIVAIDHAPDMVEAAKALNRAAIREGKVDIRECSVSEMPFREGSFDAVLAVNSVQFWPHLRLDLKSVLRILKPGGRFLIAMRMTMEPRARRRCEMLLRALPNAGFVEVTMEEATTRAMRVALIFGKRPIWAGGPYDAFVA